MGAGWLSISCAPSLQARALRSRPPPRSQVRAWAAPWTTLRYLPRETPKKVRTNKQGILRAPKRIRARISARARNRAGFWALAAWALWAQGGRVKWILYFICFILFIASLIGFDLFILSISMRRMRQPWGNKNINYSLHPWCNSFIWFIWFILFIYLYVSRKMTVTK